MKDGVLWKWPGSALGPKLDMRLRRTTLVIPNKDKRREGHFEQIEDILPKNLFLFK